MSIFNKKSFFKLLRFNLVTVILIIAMLSLFVPINLWAYASEKCYNGDSESIDVSLRQTLSNYKEEEIESENIDGTEDLIIAEEEKLRGAKSKTFITEQDKIIEKSFDYNIHYNDNGNWLPIDNTLIETNHGYKTLDNPFNYEFGKKFDLKLNTKDFEISFSYLTNKKNGSNKINIKNNKEDYFKNDKIKFKDSVFKFNSNKSIKQTKNSVIIEKEEFIDLEYELIGTNIKENIVVKEKEGVKESYIFDLDLPKYYSIKINFYGDAEICDPAGNIKFYIPKGFMIDEKGIICDNVNYNVEIINNKIYFIVNVDKDWMLNEERAYPIKIDPTFEVKEEFACETLTLYKNKDGIKNQDRAEIGGANEMAMAVRFPIETSVSYDLKIKCFRQDLLIIGNNNFASGDYEVVANNIRNDIEYLFPIETYSILFKAKQNGNVNVFNAFSNYDNLLAEMYSSDNIAYNSFFIYKKSSNIKTTIANEFYLTSYFDYATDNTVSNPTFEEDLGEYGNFKIDAEGEQFYSVNLINDAVGNIPFYLSLIMSSDNISGAPLIRSGNYMNTNFNQRLVRLGEKFLYLLPDGRRYLLPFHGNEGGQQPPSVRTPMQVSLDVYDGQLTFCILDYQHNRLLFDYFTGCLTAIKDFSNKYIKINYGMWEPEFRSYSYISSIVDSNNNTYRFNYDNNSSSFSKKIESITLNNSPLSVISTQGDTTTITRKDQAAIVYSRSSNNIKSIKTGSDSQFDIIRTGTINRTDKYVIEQKINGIVKKSRQIIYNDIFIEDIKDGKSTVHYFNSFVSKDGEIFNDNGYIAKANYVYQDKLTVESAVNMQNNTNLGFSKINTDQNLVGYLPCDSIESSFWYNGGITNKSVTTEKYVNNGKDANKSIKITGGAGGYFDKPFFVPLSSIDNYKYEYVVSFWLYNVNCANITYNTLIRKDGFQYKEPIKSNISNVKNKWQLVTVTLPFFNFDANIIYMCFGGIEGTLYIDEIKIQKILRSTPLKESFDVYDDIFRILEKHNYNPVTKEFEITYYEYFDKKSGLKLSSITHPDGTKTVYNYNSKQQLISETYLKGADSIKKDYTYDTEGRLASETYEGITTTYTYDIPNRKVTMTSGGMSYTTQYVPFKGQIDNVVVNNNSQSKTTFIYTNSGKIDKLTQNGMVVDYNYNNLDQLNNVKIGNQNYLTYNYDANKIDRINSVEYGNGQNLSYDYDAKGRITGLKQNGVTLYTYNYNEFGELVSTYDHVNGIGSSFSSVNTSDYATYSYMNSNNQYGLGNHSHYDYFNKKTVNMDYTYVNGDYLRRHQFYNYNVTTDTVAYMTLYNETLNTSRFWNFGYDSINRQISFTDGGKYQEINKYLPSGSLLYNKEYKINGTTYGSNQLSYDSSGRINSISSGNVTNKTKTYQYDNLGRLIRENNYEMSETSVITYDTVNYMNIKEIKIYNYTTSATITTPLLKKKIYTYSTTRNDQLTKILTYNASNAIITNESYGVVYDAMGNPTAYKNVDNSGNVLATNKISLEFTQGTKLSKYGNISYTYDIMGTRYSKLNGTKMTKYLYNNGQLYGEVKYDVNTPNVYEMIWYYYDLDGIRGMEYKGQIYTFMKNPLGDVIGIVDTNGNVVTKYEYDAWGNTKITALTNEVGNINPFRYRGYHYDTDTNLYYLKARFYDPTIGRFISSDTPLVLNDAIGVPGALNLYAYCFNDPINLTDENGNFVLSSFLIGIFVGALVGAINGAINSFVTGADFWKSVGIGACFGAITGAIGNIAGIYGTIISAFALSICESIAINSLTNNDINWTFTIINALVNSIFSGLLYNFKDSSKTTIGILSNIGLNVVNNVYAKLSSNTAYEAINSPILSTSQYIENQPKDITWYYVF